MASISTVFNIRMVDLIADNMVKPGKDVLSIKSGNNTYTGSLKADGFIHFEHLDLPCKSPGAFATAALRLSKPDLASCNGWTTIFYEGKPLDFYRKQLLGQMAEGVDGEVTSTRKEAPTAAAAAVPAAAAGGPSGVQEDNERVPLDPASVTPGDNSETSRKRKAVLEAARVQEESNKKARLASEAFKKAYEDLVEAERADLERAKKIMNQKAKLTKEGRLRAYSAKEAANMATDEAEAAEGLAKAAKEAAKRAEEIAEKQQLLLQQQEADEVAATDHVKAKMADLRAVEEAARRLGTA